MIKTLTNVGTEGTYLYIIKVIYDKLTANIILSAKAESLPAKFRKKTRMLTLTPSAQHSVGSSSHSNEMGGKRYPNRNRRRKITINCR